MDELQFPARLCLPLYFSPPKISAPEFQIKWPSSLSVSGTLILVFSAHRPAENVTLFLKLFCLAFLSSYPLVSIFNSCLEGNRGSVLHSVLYPFPLKRILTPQVLSDAFQAPLDLQKLLVFLPLSNSSFPRFAASSPHLELANAKRNIHFPFSWDFVPRNTDCLKSSPMPVNMFFNLAFLNPLTFGESLGLL